MKTQFITTRLIIIIALILNLSTAYSQTNQSGYELNGIIKDAATQQPLSLITVRLKNPNNDVVSISVTKNDGSFSFSSLAPVAYTLSIVAVGYGNETLLADLSNANSKKMDLNEIYLKGETTSLKQVAITADKPVIRQKADRIIYDLQADPDSKGNSILNMMRKIPYLSLDGDDNLLLKGNSSFRVLINGKPSSSLENNLKAVLRSIPAATIERIEVITIPPSKYDAEGLAGIINIITIKKVNDEISGSLNASESFPTGGPAIGSSFTYKKGKFGVSSFGGGSIYLSPETYNTNMRQTLVGSQSILRQQGNQRSNNKTAYFGSEFSYQIDSLQLLTAQFNYNLSHVKDNGQQLSALSEREIIIQQYDFENEKKSNGYGLDVGINYELGFKAVKNRLLTFSYLYSTNANDIKGNVEFSNEFNFTLPAFQQDDQQNFHEHSAQIDFSTPVKKISIEAGIKAILRNSSSDFDYRPFDSRTGSYELNPDLSNFFTNKQQVFSAYNSYQLAIANWNISAGIRLEETVIRADFISTASVADQNYFNVIPSVAISRRFKNENSINFGFSQRMRRPGINRLNPYVDRSNPNYEVTGNPALKPVLLNDIQFGFNSEKKLSVNIGLDYSFMNNLDLQVVDFNPVTQITRVTYANTGKSSSIGNNLYISYPVTKAYRASVNGSLMYLWLQGMVSGRAVDNNLLMYNITLSNVLRLDHGWALNADLSLNSRNPTGLQGYTNGFFYSAFNFNKDLVKDKLSVSGGIRNPFTKYRNSINTTFGPDFNQTYQSRNYFRSFNVSINYNFGGLKDRINKSRTSIQNNDIAN